MVRFVRWVVATVEAWRVQRGLSRSALELASLRDRLRR